MSYNYMKHRKKPVADGTNGFWQNRPLIQFIQFIVLYGSLCVLDLFEVLQCSCEQQRAHCLVIGQRHETGCVETG